MANNILIMGESGTGKSTSIRTLDPKETYIINVLDKPLPFKDYKKVYIKGSAGNYFASDNAMKITQTISAISKSMPHIKNIILDDFQFIMANEFMRRARETGFQKFNEIGQSGWDVIYKSTLCRDDLYIFFLSHTQVDDDTGISRCKTVGKMVSDKISIEAMFTVVLHSMRIDKKYLFLTQHDGKHLAKSPMGMFEEEFIENDLRFVKHKMAECLGDEIMREVNVPVQDNEKLISLACDKLAAAENYQSLKKLFTQMWAELKGNSDGRKKITSAYEASKMIFQGTESFDDPELMPPPSLPAHHNQKGALA